MRQLIISAHMFAQSFNEAFCGAYRQIDAQDVKDMADCELIHRYGYYSRSLDFPTVARVLRYEEMREKRSAKPTVDDKSEPPSYYEQLWGETSAKPTVDNKSEPPSCKMCSEPLPPQPEGKKGRPRQYCPSCEFSRVKERNRRWRRKRKRLRVATVD